MKKYIYIIGVATMMAACGQKAVVEKTQSEQLIITRVMCNSYRIDLSNAHLQCFRALI